MRRKFALVAGLTAMVAVGGAVVAAPASAGPNCDSGYHCVFYSTISSARHQYFNSDPNFSGDIFGDAGNGDGHNQSVNNNVWSASNSSTGGYESHYYDGASYSGFLFCVNPGDYISSTASNGSNTSTTNGSGLTSSLRDRASSMQLHGTTSIDCW
ncbi:hypothetical protein ACRAWF_30785 [Streptomyces sp. L7]